MVSREKGEQRERQRQSKFEGYCNDCGKWRHQWEDGWSKPQNSPEKSKAENGKGKRVLFHDELIAGDPKEDPPTIAQDSAR